MRIEPTTNRFYSHTSCSNDYSILGTNELKKYRFELGIFKQNSGKLYVVGNVIGKYIDICFIVHN